MPKNLSFDNETIHQVNSLCDMWGVSKTRGFSFAVSRAVERAFVAELAGIRVEEFSILEDDEFELLIVTLMEKINTLKGNLRQVNSDEILDILTTEITRLESLIEKIKRAK